jgi:FG-GAP-like repeat
VVDDGAEVATGTDPLDAASQPTLFTAGIPVARIFEEGAAVRALAVGDFDGANDLDLIVVEQTSGEGVLLLRTSAGTYAPARRFAAANAPAAIAVGDLDGDRDLDLAVANEDFTTPLNVTVLLNEGTGRFAAPTTFTAGVGATAIVTGDWNGDAVLDLAVAASEASISILLGHGDGTLAVPLGQTVGDFPSALSAGDWNGDGILDLVVVNDFGFSSPPVSILLGAGDGTFTSAPGIALGQFVSALTTGDWNGDGFLDLALVGARVIILLGAGDGSFTPLYVVDLERFGLFGNAIVSGDWDGDGDQDLAVAGGGLVVLLGFGDGSFAPTAISFEDEEFLTTGDVNGDGDLDLVAFRFSGNTIAIFLN